MNRNREVLVVEDHVDTLTMLAKAIKALGHNVTAAASCAEARAMAEAKNWAVDLLLCDVGLPDGDGAELMAEFKARCGCVTVAVTGYGMARDLARYSAHRIDRCLVKPVELQQLRSALALEGQPNDMPQLLSALTD
jgi:two-component system KDP operon response regulator KdpE